MTNNLPRCETCVHWESDRVSILGRTGARALCLAKKLDNISDPDGAYIPGVPAAFLSTGPKFGCVHHEEQGNP